MKKAIFLDRDGVINDGTLYYTYKIEDFQFNLELCEGLRLLLDPRYIYVVITNQGGVAKGEYTEHDVEVLHAYMCEKLKEQGIDIAGVYYCPHYPSVTGPCECRKPGTLLIEKAIAAFDIDRTQSYLIGDGERDIEAAQRAEIVGVKITKNENIVPYCKKIISGER